MSGFRTAYRPRCSNGGDKPWRLSPTAEMGSTSTSAASGATSDANSTPGSSSAGQSGYGSPESSGYWPGSGEGIVVRFYFFPTIASVSQHPNHTRGWKMKDYRETPQRKNRDFFGRKYLACLLAVASWYLIISTLNEEYTNRNAYTCVDILQPSPFAYIHISI